MGSIGHLTTKAVFQHHRSVRSRNQGALSKDGCSAAGVCFTTGLSHKSFWVGIFLIRRYMSHVIDRSTVLAYLNLTEPEAVKHRKQKCFRRKRFWSAGVMDIWMCDQHDKWKRFSLVTCCIGSVSWRIGVAESLVDKSESSAHSKLLPWGRSRKRRYVILFFQSCNTQTVCRCPACNTKWQGMGNVCSCKCAYKYLSHTRPVTKRDSTTLMVWQQDEY